MLIELLCSIRVRSSKKAHMGSYKKWMEFIMRRLDFRLKDIEIKRDNYFLTTTADSSISVAYTSSRFPVYEFTARLNMCLLSLLM